MAESSSELPSADDRPITTTPDSTPPPVLPLGAVEPTDNSPTVISKNTPRSLSADEAANGIRGRKLAHFELLDRIGVGGMAAVLRARDTQLDRIVALKILPPDLAQDEENVRRFHQEARSAAKLDHENVARVFFCGEDQRLHFIAFEFVEGDNLRTVMERRGRLPVGLALHYMLQVAAGLAHAAERGVVHRDIKPSNIIITPNGRAKLVDMGLARSLGPQPEADLTQSGVTLGTFDYISPEQALEPRDADVRSDIYSLGCTFYHMLTGRPPVPEGTAARKLHHHQHVKPRDPRELVHDLPDEVAVILDRMLAKQPRDRYQTPLQLVQHLLAAARKVGAVAEVPEGVLAVEAVVPAAPRYRPVLIAALATVAVVVLILVLGQGTSRPLVDIDGPPVTAPRAGRDNSTPHDKDPVPTTRPEIGVAVGPVKGKPAVYDADDPTQADLTKWLQDNAKAEELDVRLAHGLDVSADLLFKAPKISIRAKNLQRPVTVRLTYDAGASAAARTAFTVQGREVTVEGICFLIDAHDTPDIEMIGLHCASGGSYTVRRCQFVQAQSPLDQKKGMASIVVDGFGATANRTKLTLSECCFLGFGELTNRGDSEPMQLDKAERGGFEAVVRRGSVQVEAVDCAFGPHAADFRLEGKSPQEVQLLHCSVLEGARSAVFALGDGAGAALKVEHNLFSCPVAAEGNGAVLVRQSGSEGEVSYDGHDNRFHNLADPSWDGPAASQPAVAKEAAHRLANNPWSEDQPLDRLDGLRFDPKTADDGSLYAGRQEQIGKAFQINFQTANVALPERSLDLLGMRQLGSISFVAKLPTVAKNQRIVDPTYKERDKNVYPTLSSAVGDAKPGDTIVIRCDGDLTIKPVILDDAAADLIVRPAAGYHPVLVLGLSPNDDAALFRVYDSKIQFEGLEFRLEPKPNPKGQNFKAQVVAAVVGNGQCEFKNCVVTLDPAASLSTALAAASIAEVSGMMKDGVPARSQPALSFVNCVVRGQGDLVWDRAGRPFDLGVTNSLAVLAGNFLNLEVPTEPAPPTLVNATLTNVTAYTTDHFIRMNGKDLKNLPALNCKTSGCLFVAAARHSLVHLEGPPMNKDQLKDKFSWSVGETGNFYAGFVNDMLDQRPQGEEMPPPAIVSNKWMTFTNDTTSKQANSVKFAAAPAPDGSFNRVAPAHFKTMELTGYGADVGTLPKPALTSPEMEE